MDIMQAIRENRVVPVVVIEKSEDAVPTAQALHDGGVDVMEITFRTDAAAESIRFVAENCPFMLVGAGSVANLDQCRQALSLGAKFIVSAGFDPETVSYCLSHNVPVLPGCVSPTEIIAARKMGLDILKFFPANVFGGLPAMKALSAPFPGLQFVPTGGVNAKNLAEYVKASFVYAIGGSWLCTKKDISEHNFETITALCKEARAIVEENK